MKVSQLYDVKNALIDGNPMWDWNEEIAQRLLKKYPKKLIKEVRASPQMICNCFRCTELYLDKWRHTINKDLESFRKGLN